MSESVDVAAIHPAKHNPRRELLGIDELAESMQAVGQQQPIKVRKVGGKLELIFGQRRLAAAKKLGWKCISAIVMNEGVVGDEEARIAAIVENAQREDPHPMDEAEAIEALDDAGASIDEIGARLGVTRAFIGQRRRLLALEPKARQAFRDGKIGLADALLVARVEGKLQLQVLGDAIGFVQDDEGERLFRAEELLRHLPKIAEAKFDPADASLPGGACTTCPKRSGSQTALFADALEETELCTSPECYRTKHKHAYPAVVETAKAEGVTIATKADSAKVFPSPRSTVPSHGYVSLDTPVSRVLGSTSKKTLGEWAKSKGVDLKPMLVRRHDEAPVFVAKRKHVESVWAKTKPRSETKLPESVQSARAEAKLEEAIERAIVAAALDANAAHPWSERAADGDVVLRAALAELVAHANASLISDREDMQAALKQLQQSEPWVRPGRVVANAAPDMQRGEVLYWMARYLLSRCIPDEHAALLEVLGVDVDAITKSVRADAEAVAKAKATKAKSAASKKPTKRKPKKSRKKEPF